MSAATEERPVWRIRRDRDGRPIVTPSPYLGASYYCLTPNQDGSWSKDERVMAVGYRPAVTR